MIYGLLNLLRADGSVIVNKKLMHSIGVNETIIYSELISRYLYFENKNQLTEDGFFYNTIDDLYQGTALSRKQQDKCIKNLKTLNLIDCKLKGIPAVRHFKPNLDMNIILKYLGGNEKQIKKVVETKKSDSTEPDSQRNNKVPATDNSIAEIDNFFNDIWGNLPSKMKKGKSQVSKTKKIKLMKVGKEKLNQCLKLYLEETKKLNRYFMNGSTWFNTRYEDYIEQVQKQRVVKKEVEYKTEDMIEKEFINLYMQKNREKYNDRSELNLKAQEEWIEMRTNIINKTENNISSEDLLNKLIKNLEKYKNE